MERLADAFISRAGDAVQGGDLGPFESQTVVVQSFGMGQWLKIRQAERLGIAANMDCILPANLIWRLYQTLLPEFDLPTESPFSIERLTWHLMKRFPECQDEQFNAVRQFLDGPGDTQVRAYQLGEKIGTLFDQYLIYRPAWMNGWDEGADSPDSWQRTLWQMLINEPALRDRNHRARLHAALLERLARDDQLPAGVPRHISVMGLSTLPPIHLEALQALSRHVDVDLYFLNPCQHYWGDIVSQKDRARRSIRAELGKSELSDEDYLEIGNPLLSSWGKQGREFLELLLETEGAAEAEFFEDPEGDRMLDVVKRDILELTYGGVFGEETTPDRAQVDADDLSIQIHVCHSKLREVEVLYDQLLRLFQRNPGLRPADVIVMTPDVADYAPFIESVFPKSKLPYSITDRAPGEKSPVLVALSTLLALPDLRVTSTEIMDLLEVPTIARRFGLEDRDLQLITRWIKQSGIRWEIDESTRADRWQVPRERVNTWRFGLDRLLLGFAMEKSDGIFDGILPTDVESQEAGVLATLCQFIDTIAHFRSELSRPRPAAEWRELLLNLLDAFFDPKGEEELDLVAVRELMIRLEEETTLTGFGEPLSPKLLGYWLDQQLSISQQSRGFISGVITFATLVPMRSIPFRVVCLLGMNDNKYPREDRPPTFDLMATMGYQRGDRSKRNDDRYLFLEALISAQDTFYISYEGRSIRDNKERPPSVLVSEFANYLDQVFEQNVTTVHPLQPFSEEYFQANNQGLVTFNQQWYQALIEPGEAVPFDSGVLNAESDLEVSSLAQLTRFLRHPAKAYLQDRLGVYLAEDDVELDDAEPFTLNSLEQFDLTAQMIDVKRGGEDFDRFLAETRASGLVMAGEVGARQLATSENRADLIIEQLREVAPTETADFEAECQLPSGKTLYGRLTGIFEDTLVEFRPSQMRARRLLVAWANHLFVNAARGETTSILLSIRSDKLCIDELSPIEPARALEHLDTLVAMCADNVSRPVPLIPETSFAYFEATREQLDREQIEAKALAKWDSEQIASEGQDPYFNRLFQFPDDFTEAFVDTATAVLGPLREHWQGKLR